MKVLVFGHDGQVATELRRLDGSRGVRITAVGRAAADLTDPVAPSAAIGTHRPDVVINAAAYTAVDRAEEEVAQAMRLNATAPGAMARSCAALGIPFVHISSDYVFDGNGSAAFAPGDPVAPLGAYGRSKQAGEAAVLAAGARAAILRTSWVFSAHGSNFVRTMLRLAETRDQLSVVADQIGGPTPAADIASALLTMARAMTDGQRGGIHHFAGAPDVSWAGFARAVFAQAGRDVEVTDIPSTDYPTPAPRPLNSRLDCASLAADFGIKRPDWQAGLAAVLTELGERA